MTVTQFDDPQHIARRLNAASLAVRALGTDAAHQAVEEALTDINEELLRAVAEARS
jgi:hypothetical protein